MLLDQFYQNFYFDILRETGVKPNVSLFLQSFLIFLMFWNPLSATSNVEWIEFSASITDKIFFIFNKKFRIYIFLVSFGYLMLFLFIKKCTICDCFWFFHWKHYVASDQQTTKFFRILQEKEVVYIIKDLKYTPTFQLKLTVTSITLNFWSNIFRTITQRCFQKKFRIIRVSDRPLLYMTIFTVKIIFCTQKRK